MGASDFDNAVQVVRSQAVGDGQKTAVLVCKCRGILDVNLVAIIHRLKSNPIEENSQNKSISGKNGDPLNTVCSYSPFYMHAQKTGP